MGIDETKEKIEEKMDYRKYAKYILTQGSVYEKRELLSCLKGKLKLNNSLLIMDN